MAVDTRYALGRGRDQRKTVGTEVPHSVVVVGYTAVFCSGLCVSLSLAVSFAIHCLSIALCLSPEFSAGVLCLCSLSLHICSRCPTSR
jgi:hypothetical protein